MTTLCCGPRSSSKSDAGDSAAAAAAPAEPEVTTGKEASQNGKLTKRKSWLGERLSSTSEPSNATSSAAAAPAAGSGAATVPGTFGNLRVKVLKGEDLMGMDTRLEVTKMSIETTLDAFVRLSLNGDPEPFGQTDVQWRSKGDPEWNQSFCTGLVHPTSWLCVYVCDDDEIFHRDGVLPPLTRNCGFVEIPLWELPRNTPVTGWFTLNHPDLDQGTLGDRSSHDSKEVAEQKLPDSAGQVLLQLTLETTAVGEFMARFTQPAPVFETSLPPLDVPGFIEDVQEVKRLLLQRLILAPIKMVLYAISWEDPALSAAVLCWHWFVCYFPRFIWPTIWFFLLLCFWHDIPQQQEKEKKEGEPDEEPPAERKNLVTGIFGGAYTMVSSVGTGVRDLAAKPVEGAMQGGIRGLAVGMKDGVVSGIKNTGQGVIGGVKGVADGVVGTVQSAAETVSAVHSPGLQEFQQILQLKPALRDMVRGFQPTVDSAHNGLQKVDDIFYWADAKLTEKVCKGIIGMIVVSTLFSGWSAKISGYGWLLVGTLIILAKAKAFKSFVRAVTSGIAIATRPKVAFKARRWFKAVDAA